MARRYIVEKENVIIKENIIEVTGKEVHHINVMRFKVGDTIDINEYVCKIQTISKESLVAEIIDEVQKIGEPTVNIDLYMGYIKADKMEYLVQKSVELGVKNIIPILTKNAVVKLDEKDRAKKRERLQKIAIEAIGQCGRTDNVEVKEIKKIEEILKEELNYDLILVCHEKEEKNIQKVLKEAEKEDIQKIAVFIGPEGGLDNEEVQKILKQENSKVICFGERVLRAETAVNYILSVLDYTLG